MKLVIYLFLVSAALVSCSYAKSLPSDTTDTATQPDNQTESVLVRLKRQYGYGMVNSGQMAHGGYQNQNSRQLYPSSNEYNEYYGDYSDADYAYDYYDWICSDKACTLCDILTSECCDPVTDEHCFLPDSCLNNPCLSGGTCITTKTVDDRADFICVCLPGLTGKYCQLASEYQPPASNPYPAASSYNNNNNRMPQAQMQQLQQPMAYMNVAPQQQVVQQQPQQSAYAMQTPQAGQPSQYSAPAQRPQVQAPQAPSSYAAQPQQQQQQQPLVPSQPAIQVQSSMPHHYIQQSFRAQPLSLTKKFDLSSEQEDEEAESSDENVVRLAATKRKRCEDGQVFSVQKQECVQFALNRVATNIRK